MNSSTWVFGYGSLVSPASVARTLGRDVGRDVVLAMLGGYGRRWNYGSLHQRASWTAPGGPVVDGVVVCLGLEAATSERCNGAVFPVTDDELALLDWRERDYDRVDVTDRIAIVDPASGTPAGGSARPAARVVTYVPRPSAVERYREARDHGRAAVKRTYHELVDRAFAVHGDVHVDEYRTSTPPADVPIVDAG